MALGAACAVWLSACTAPPSPSCAPGLEASKVESLYFGTSKPGGGTVSDPEWQAFLDEVVTPRFPDGLSVLSAAGQWKSSQTGRIVAERSFVLNVVHPGTAQQAKAFAEIIAAYKQRFAQESVLQLSTAACAAF